MAIEEYPKMLFKGDSRKNNVVVKDTDEQKEAEAKGYKWNKPKTPKETKGFGDPTMPVPVGIAKVEYPKMLYKSEKGREGVIIPDLPDKHNKLIIVVNNKEEQLIRQAEGFFEHDGSVIGGKETSFPCDKCDFIGKDKIELEEHVIAKHSLKCSECDFIAETEELLIAHKKDAHPSFACDKCDYIGKNKQALTMHNTMKHKE